jgi:MFS family permease
MTTQNATSSYTRGERASIIVSCMLGFALDLYDVLILPFIMGSIQKSLNISLTYVASITSVTLIGSVIGGAIFGALGDKLGRKNALQLTLAVFALGSIASAFSWNYWSLAVLRFITGIGLGGEWGAGMVLFNEAWNKDRRGLGSAFIQGSAVLASASASIVGIWAITSFSQDWGWRIALLTGGSPIILMVFIRFFMPESKIWVDFDKKRRSGDLPVSIQRENTLIAMFRGPLFSISIIALIWMMAYMFFYYAVIVFVPTLMLKVMNTPPDVVRTTSVVVSIIGGMTYISMGWLNDRLGRRFGALIPSVFWLVSLAGIYLYSHNLYQGAILLWPFFWIYILFGMGNTSLGVVGTWLSELYPVDVRATAVSTIYMAGRAVGSIAPVLVPLVAAYAGDNLVMGLMIALPAGLIFICCTLLLPETRGRDLAGTRVALEQPGSSASSFAH